MAGESRARVPKAAVPFASFLCKSCDDSPPMSKQDIHPLDPSLILRTGLCKEKDTAYERKKSVRSSLRPRVQR